MGRVNPLRGANVFIRYIASHHWRYHGSDNVFALFSCAAQGPAAIHSARMLLSRTASPGRQRVGEFSQQLVQFLKFMVAEVFFDFRVECFGVRRHLCENPLPFGREDKTSIAADHCCPKNA